ncbi:MAG: hypothetical protein HDT14_05500, partial [Oscillibacter sp.]|nr:hypothetical protein [Oscillibacter sp.]
MKLKRLACGVLSAVMSFSLLVGPGGFVIPARADHDTPDDDQAIQTDSVYDESVPDTEVPDETAEPEDETAEPEDEATGPEDETTEPEDETTEPEDSELDEYYETMRRNWRAFLLGGNGDDLDLDNPVIASYVDSLNTEANGYWNDLIVRSAAGYGYYIFSDLNIEPLGPRVTGAEATQRTANMGNTFRHLVALAKAWSTRGCDLYGDETVLEEIINATDYMVSNFYEKDQY